MALLHLAHAGAGKVLSPASYELLYLVWRATGPPSVAATTAGLSRKHSSLTITTSARREIERVTLV